MSGLSSINSVYKDNMILPHWHASEAPDFYARSQTNYATVDSSEICKKRGIYDHLLLDLVAKLPQGAYVAGGAVAALLRNDKSVPSDIDIFFDGPDAFLTTYNLFNDPNPGREFWPFQNYTTNVARDALEDESDQLRLVKFSSDNKERLPVQLVKMIWYTDAEHVIDSFDFTVSQFCLHSNLFTFNPMAMMDLFSKNIVVHRHQYPGDTLYRMVKYVKKGYQVPPSSLITIAENIMESDSMGPPSMGLRNFY